MSRIPQAWHPDLHPRWPAGAPAGKGGEFRDRGGPQPIAGGGSVATGKSTQCPVCGRVVKIVGNGKQSTHNISKGVRCDGSGKPVSGPTDQTLRQMREAPKKAAAKKPPRKKPGRPAPGPQLMLPASLKAPVDHPDARARMAAWRASGGTATRTDWDPIRLRVIKGIEKQLGDHQYGPAIFGREQHFKNIARDEMREQNRQNIGHRYYDPYTEEDRIAWGFDERVREIEQEYDAQKLRLQQELTRVKAGGPSDSLSAADLDLPDQSSYPWQVPASDLDPEHPLAVYGDKLHFDDSWLSYVALDSLEQRIPPEYHREIAKYLAEKDGGIWIGTAPLPDQDNLGYLRGLKPRGWRAGATWNDVDGVVSSHTTMAVGFTPNTESSYWRVRRRREQVGLPIGELHDYTATLHEFGHLADYALGQTVTQGTFTYRERASKQRLFRLLYGRVLREAGPGLNPYFRQKAKATKDSFGRRVVRDAQGPGAEEFWADAFGTYMAYDPTPITEGPVAVWRTTQRRAALAREYDVSLDVAAEIERYFDRHHKDLIAGRRTAYTDRRRV